MVSWSFWCWCCFLNTCFWKGTLSGGVVYVIFSRHKRGTFLEGKSRRVLWVCGAL